jgi:hypothetical protein
LSRGRVRTRSGSKRSLTPYLVLALVVATAIVGYYIFTQSAVGNGSPLDGTPASPKVLNYLDDVSLQTISIVGDPQAATTTPPTSISGSNLTLNGKPEVLYMGAEYCPFCGAERWAMIVALDKFGTFTGIEYMQSTSDDIYPNTPTFSFVNANYTSQWISFVSVEQEDRAEAPLQTATSEQTALINQYDSGASIPFIDFGNQYKITGSQYIPSILAPANGNWTLIASQLNNTNSTYTQSIDGAAAQIIAAICKIDGNQPSTVCSNTFAQQTLSYVKAPDSGSQLIASDVFTPPRAVTSRQAPDRLSYSM